MSLDSAMFHAYQVNYQFIAGGCGGGEVGEGVKGTCSNVVDQEKFKWALMWAAILIKS